MKKSILVFSTLILLVSCTTSKETVKASNKDEKKVETTVKSPSSDRDARGNYLK